MLLRLTPRRLFIWLIDGITFIIVCLVILASMTYTSIYIKKKSVEAIPDSEFSEKLRKQVPQLAEYIEDAGKPVAIAFIDFACHRCHKLWETMSMGFEQLNGGYDLILVPESTDTFSPICKMFIDHNHALRTLLHIPVSPSLVILEPAKSPIVISTTSGIKNWLRSRIQNQNLNQYGLNRQMELPRQALIKTQ